MAREGPDPEDIISITLQCSQLVWGQEISPLDG